MVFGSKPTLLVLLLLVSIASFTFPNPQPVKSPTPTPTEQTSTSTACSLPPITEPLTKVFTGPGIPQGSVPINTVLTWTVKYTVADFFSVPMTSVILSDHFAANLAVDTTTIVFFAPPGSGGTAPVFTTSTGTNPQWRFTWSISTLQPGQSATMSVNVFTRKNPSGAQEFTSGGLKILNSGAFLNWVQSASSQQFETLPVYVIAGSTVGAVVGVVTSNGVGVSGVTVSLFSGTKLVATTKTQDLGFYHFDSVVSGTYTVSVTTGTGTSTITITVYGGVVTNQQLSTGSSDFALSASPAFQSSVTGASASYAITVASLGGFAGTIGFTSSVSPAGPFVNLSPSSVALSASGSAMTALTAASTTAGVFTITVTASSGGLCHSILLIFNVMGFAISASPVFMTVEAGSSGTSTVSLTSQNGFSGVVNLLAGVSPSAVQGPTPFISTSVFVPSGGTSTSTLTLTTSGLTPAGTYSIIVTGSGSGVTHSVTVTLVVTNTPDFSITAVPGIITVAPGSSATSAVSITSISGFSGPVTLVASGPSGVSASVLPSSISLGPGPPGVATLTVSSQVPGSYPVTVFGSSGVLSHIATVTVIVSVGTDFALSASPGALAIVAGSSGSSAIAVTSINGFSGGVSLSPSPPPGLSASINSGSVSVTSGQTKTVILAVTVSPSTPAGTYSVGISGVSGSLSHSVTVSVIVTTTADFTVLPSPATLGIAVGSTGVSTITVTSVNGFSGPVTLSASGPSAVSVVPASTTVTLSSGGSTTAPLTIGSSTPGSYTITVTGSSGSITHAATISVTVNALSDFTISATPSALVIPAGSSGTSSISLSSLNSFAGTVLLSTTPSSGLTPSLGSNSVSLLTGTGGTTLTISVSSSTPAGSYTVPVMGVSGPLSHSVTISITVTNPADFSIVTTPGTLTLAVGSSGTVNVGVNSLNSFAGSVTLSAVSPTGLTSSLTVQNVPVAPAGSVSTTLLITSTGTTVLGTYTVMVGGVSGSLSHSVTVTVDVISSPDFTINPAPSTLTILAGTSGSSTITVNGLNGFTGMVTLSTSAPSGLSASLTLNSVSLASGLGFSTLDVSVASSTILGVYSVIILGTGGSLSHSVTVSVNVTLPADFSVSDNPGLLTIVLGSSGSSTILLTGLNDFSGSVVLSSMPPTGLSASFDSNNLPVSPGSPGSSTLTITTASGLALGSYVVTVSATSGALNHSITLPVNVIAVPDFTISMNPGTVVIAAGSSGTSTVILNSLNNFAGAVTLSTNGPSSVLSSIPANVQNLNAGSSVSTALDVSSSTPGTYIVTVSADSGNINHSTTIIVTVTSSVDFFMCCNPTQLTLPVGSSGTTTIQLNSINGFTGIVTISAAAPAGLSTSPSSTVFLTSGGSASAIVIITVGSQTAAGIYNVNIVGTGNGISHSVSVSVTVPATDFGISASPNSLTIATGSPARTAILLNSVNGFAGSVGLSNTPPLGLSVSLGSSTVSLASGSGSSTLTVSVTTAQAGVYSVIVSASDNSGSITRSTTITVNVLGDFSISATPITTGPGLVGISAITVTSVAGFSGSVMLSVTTLPGLSPSFVSPSVTLNPGGTGNDVLDIFASTAGAFTLTITGKSGILVRTTSITLDVVDFTIQTEPVLTVTAGSYISSNINLASINGLAGPIDLTTSVCPPNPPVGPGCIFPPSPGPVFGLGIVSAPTVTLTPFGSSFSSLIMAPDPSIIAGNYTVRVKAVDPVTLLTHSVSVKVKVTGDFGLTVPPNPVLTTSPGSGGSVSVSLTSLGLSGPIQFSWAVSPSGLFVSPSGPNFVSPGPPLIFSIGIFAASTALAGTYNVNLNVTVLTTSGSVSHTSILSVVVKASEFSITVTASLTVPAGTSASVSVNVTSLNGFSGVVNLGASPASMASIAPASVTLSVGELKQATLQVTVDLSTIPGTYSVTVTGTDTAGFGDFVIVTVTVVGPDFSISVSPPSQTVPVSSPGVFTITLSSENGFSGLIALSYSQPPGTVASGPPSIGLPGGTTNANFAVFSPSLVLGTFTINVTATSLSGPSISHSAIVTIIFVEGFTISTNNPIITVPAGNLGQTKLTLSSVDGFSGQVALSALASDAGAFASLTKQTVSISPGSDGSTDLQAGAMTAGTFLVNVTGTSGQLARSIIVVVIVQDFSISASSTLTVPAGTSGTSVITIGSINGLATPSFGGPSGVILSLSSSSPMLSLNPSTVSLTPGNVASSILTLTTTPSTPAGTFILIVTGTYGTLVHSVQITVTVTGDFQLSSNPSSLTITAGSSSSSTIAISSAGFSGSVSVFIGMVTPQGLGVVLSQAGISGPITLAPGSTSIATLTVITSGSTQAGSYLITVMGTDNTGRSHSVTVSVTIVVFADFCIFANPSYLTINAGSTGTSTITLSSISGLSSTIMLTAFAPQALSASFSSNSVALSPGGSSTSILTLGSSTPGAYTVTVTGNSGPLSHSAVISVIVTAVPDFTVSATPTTLTIASGSSGSSVIKVTSLNGFAGSLTLSTILPSSISASFNSTSVPLTAGTSGFSLLTLNPTTTGLFSVSVNVTYTAGGFSHIITIPVTVTASPDFTLSPSPPTLTITAGSSGTSSITLTSANGFTGSISLSTAIDPSQVSGPLSSVFPSIVNLVSGSVMSSTLTVTTTVSTPLGTYTANVIGVNSGVSHTITVSVVIVAPPDFTISPSPTTIIVAAGSSGSSTITVTSLNAFTGTVILSAVPPSALSASFPPPANVQLSPNGAGASLLAVSASSSVTAGTYAVTVTGSSGTLSHSLTLDVTVIVPADFSLSANPAILTISAGSSETSTINVGSINGFGGTVMLSRVASSAIQSFTSSTTIAGSGLSSLTVTTTGSTPVGIYSVNVTGVSGTLSHMVTISVNVTSLPDFTISSTPAALTVSSGSSGTSAILLSSLNGFTGFVNLSSSPENGLSSSLASQGTSLPGGTGVLLTITAPSATLAGAYTVTVTGTSGSIIHTTTVSVTVVVLPDFSIVPSPQTITLASGSSATSSIILTSLNGFTGTVTISATPPVGLSTAFVSSNTVFLSPSGSGSLTLNVTAASSTAPGAYSIIVSGSSGALFHSVTLLVIVTNLPDFNLKADPAVLTINTGSSATSALTASSINSFTGTISLGALISGPLTFSFTANTIAGGSGSSVITVATTPSTPAGVYTVTVTGSSGSLSHSLTLDVIVTTLPDFTLSASPGTISVLPGSSGSALIPVSSLFGFAGGVVLLSASSHAVSTSLVPFSVSLTPSSTVTGLLSVSVPLSTPIGNYFVSVTGTSGTISHSVIILVVVPGPDFSISANPSNLTILEGSSASSTIILTSLLGFSGAVAMVSSGVSGGSLISLSPTSVLLSPDGSATSQLSITTTAASLPGNYNVTIIGTSGVLTHSFTVHFTVPSPDFTIATDFPALTISACSIGCVALIPVNLNITLTSISGFSGSVNLLATAPGQALFLSMSPSMVGLSSGGTAMATLSVSATGLAIGQFLITVTGVIGNISHSIYIQVTVTP